MNHQPILEIRDVCAGYRGAPVLSDVTLSVERGLVYAIIGPNGCGKTTLLRVISRSLRPTAGRVLLDGADIFKTNTKRVARKLAILAQSNHTMSDVTVKKLVSYGRFAHKEWWQGTSSEDEQIVEWAIRRTNLTGYEDRRINTLSGGERQRAWIAMSLAQRPEVLLLDEPTTYLDVSHQLEIMELVRSLNLEDGITVVMVLHDINHAARYSDRLVVMNDGRIDRMGKPWDVFESGVLRDVFRVEAEITREEESGHPIFYAKRRLD